jgi:hypothetical protein
VMVTDTTCSVACWLWQQQQSMQDPSEGDQHRWTLHCFVCKWLRSFKAQRSLYVPHSGHYMYRTVVTICTAQWSLYVLHSGHYMYRTAVTVFTGQRSLYVPDSGHCMYRTVVTICTTSLIFSKSTFCPHSVFMCFVWIWEQTAIISLYNINWLVCITETECVYCAVRTACSNISRSDLMH